MEPPGESISALLGSILPEVEKEIRRIIPPGRPKGGGRNKEKMNMEIRLALHGKVQALSEFTVARAQTETTRMGGGAGDVLKELVIREFAAAAKLQRATQHHLDLVDLERAEKIHESKKLNDSVMVWDGRIAKTATGAIVL